VLDRVFSSIIQNTCLYRTIPTPHAGWIPRNSIHFHGSQPSEAAQRPTGGRRRQVPSGQHERSPSRGLPIAARQLGYRTCLSSQQYETRAAARLSPSGHALRLVFSASICRLKSVTVCKFDQSLATNFIKHAIFVLLRNHARFI
jgi:hypothetical protein